MLKWSELSARERNELVAEKVMDLKRGVIADGDCTLQVWDGKLLPAYSQEIAAAWEVVERLWESPENHDIQVSTDIGGWRCSILRDGVVFRMSAPTAPEAICLVALKACGVAIE